MIIFKDREFHSSEPQGLHLNDGFIKFSHVQGFVYFYDVAGAISFLRQVIMLQIYQQFSILALIQVLQLYQLDILSVFLLESTSLCLPVLPDVQAFQFFFHGLCFFVFYLKTHCQTQGGKVTGVFSYVIIQKFHGFAFYMIYDPFRAFFFFERCKVYVQKFAFFFLMSSCYSTICCIDCPFLNCLLFFVKGQLLIFMWICFWVLYSVQLFYLFFHQCHFLDCCSFKVSLDVRLYQSSTFVQYCVGILALLPFYVNLRINLPVSTK